MNEHVFKCGVCGGNVYPCTLTVESMSRDLLTPTKCPFGYKNPKWEGVKE